MKKKDEIDELSELLNSIKVTKENFNKINEAREFIQQGDYKIALKILRECIKENDIEENKNIEENEEEIYNIYPRQLINTNLEERYIGMLLNDLKGIAKYYILFDDCYFADKRLLEIYKILLFTDAEKYAPVIAKAKFNFANITYEINLLKSRIKEDCKSKNFDMEKIYVELRKLFVLRKNYISMPIKEIQDKVVDIVNYNLYKKMSIEEVESAIVQINATKRFKQSILNSDLSKFLILGENNLTNGLSLPFPILTSVFKGVRRGETMAFAMPSNAGKSRFTLNFAATIAFVEKKKVLIISNEMSEDKMKLCLITTILNNEKFQNLHGQNIKKREDELLEFKFRPDNTDNIKIDKDGFVIKEGDETQEEFARRLSQISTEFNKTIKVTDWVNKQINNSLYFVNIT